MSSYFDHKITFSRDFRTPYVFAKYFESIFDLRWHIWTKLWSEIYNHNISGSWPFFARLDLTNYIFQRCKPRAPEVPVPLQSAFPPRRHLFACRSSCSRWKCGAMLLIKNVIYRLTSQELAGQRLQRYVCDHLEAAIIAFTLNQRKGVTSIARRSRFKRLFNGR